MTPSETTQNPEARRRPPPPLWRRLAAFLYEGVILFGLVVIGGLLYSPLVGQRHALQGSQGLQLVLFMLIGIYFVWFWRKTGQTLPMKTWHIRLVRRDGQGLSALQAAGRYLLCWLWFIPALWGAQQGHLGSTGQMFLALLAGVVSYAALALLLPGKQFLHDVLVGTQLVDERPAVAEFRNGGRSS